MKSAGNMQSTEAYCPREIGVQIQLRGVFPNLAQLKIASIGDSNGLGQAALTHIETTLWGWNSYFILIYLCVRERKHIYKLWEFIKNSFFFFWSATHSF